MRRRRLPHQRSGRTLPGLFVAFVLGGIVGFWTHATVSQRPNPVPAGGSTSIGPVAPSAPPAAPAAREPADSPRPTATAGTSDIDHDPITDLRRHGLRLPLDDASVKAMKGGFGEARNGEPHGHEAVDLLAPRNTPIRAVEDGKIARLFVSKAGGNTIYQFDPSERYCYYYAHLDHYASGLREGMHVAKGDVIGYVGTSGNAPANTPHLHFAILQLGDDKRWWKGTAIDPYLVYNH